MLSSEGCFPRDQSLHVWSSEEEGRAEAALSQIQSGVSGGCAALPSPQAERAGGLVARDAAMETHVQMGRGGDME